LVSAYFSATGNYIFERLGRKEGLSNSSVSSIIQDKNGFLWFGTQGGLNRFDGINFKTYEHDPYDKTSLPHRLIQTMYLDYDNNVLWIGTYNGLARFDIDSETFTHYKHIPNDDTSLSNEVVTAITKDNDGNIWVGTLNGLNVLNPETGVIKKYPASDDERKSISGNTIRSLLKDNDGNIWVGTLTGLNLYNKENDSFQLFSSKQYPIFKTDYIMALDQDEDGIIWIGNWGNGLLKFNPKTFQFDLIKIADNTIYTLKVEKDRSIWAGTWGGGLYEYDFNSDSVLEFRYDERNPGSLSHDTVYSIFIDDSGLIWIGTNGNGLNKLNRRKIDYRKFSSSAEDELGISRGKVNSILEDSEGNLWFGIYNGGLNKFDVKEQKIFKYVNIPDDDSSLSNNIVTFIYEDSQNNLWIGTNEGFNKYLPETDNFKRFLPDGTDINPTGSIVYQMLEDKHNNLWIGYYKNGVDIWNLEENRFVNYKSDEKDSTTLSDNLVYYLIEDVEGNIWIGTNNGLNRYDEQNDNFVRYFNDPQDKNTISNNTVRTLFEDSRGNIWIGTSSGGITIMNEKTGKITHYSKKDGLSDNAISSILEDDKGNIWIATSYGINIYDYKLDQFKHITEQDGLWGMEFNQGHEKAKDGSLYFGAMHGIYVFKQTPEMINFHEPQIHIIDIKVMNEIFETEIPYYNLDEISLPYNRNFISFEFIGIDYFSPEKNQYAYKLEGVDSEWIYSGNRNYMSYSNLQPGNYTFRIKAANNDGIWNDTGTSIKLIIASPPWQTWWAYLLYIIIAFVLIYFILMGMNLKLKKESAENSNKAKSEFLANISHEVRTPLNSIIGFSTLLSETEVNDLQQQYLSTLKNSAHSLLAIINDILDISKIEAGKIEMEIIRINLPKLLEQSIDMVKYQSSVKGIELVLNISPEVPEHAYFDPVRLKQILLNLLNNAIKFTHEGEVELAVDFASSDSHTGIFSFSIRDTGIGISEEKQKRLFKSFSQADASTTRKYGGTGLGLFISKNFVNKMGGTISVESTEGAGSTFSFKVETKYDERTWLSDKSIESKQNALLIGKNTTLFNMLNKVFSEVGVVSSQIDSIENFKSVQKGDIPFDFLIIDYHQKDHEQLTAFSLELKQKIHQPKTILLINAEDRNNFSKTVFDHSLIKPFKTDELLNLFRRTENQLPNNIDGIHKPITLKKSPKILIVEDVRINMLLISTIIKQILNSPRIYSAENGKLAFEAVANENFDVILMDIQMPEVDGIEATKLIRKLESEKEIRTPIIALTAGAVAGEKEKCLNAGMDDFLTKPINRTILEKTLLKFLSPSDMIQQEIKIISQEKNFKHFDKEQLLQKLENDKDTLMLLLDAAENDIEERIKKVKEAAEIKDYEIIRIEAHAIKGSSLEICLNKFGEMAREVEIASKEKKSDIKNLILQLDEEWAIVKKEIKRENIE
jgi:signal transduction histidine kinase/ligand-binding sensor domain-containing protein/CheY-like chemotaxis protein